MSRGRLKSEQLTVLDAKDATGAGTAYDVSAYRHILVGIGTASSANLTCKCQGSGLRPEDVTWAGAQSVANLWDYIAMYDLEDASKVDGDTGFVVSGTDDFRYFMVNVDALNSINFRVTARSAGSVTVHIWGFGG